MCMISGIIDQLGESVFIIVWQYFSYLSLPMDMSNKQTLPPFESHILFASKDPHSIMAPGNVWGLAKDGFPLLGYLGCQPILYVSSCPSTSLNFPFLMAANLRLRDRIFFKAVWSVDDIQVTTSAWEFLMLSLIIIFFRFTKMWMLRDRLLAHNS